MQHQKASHTFGPFYDKNSEILIREWQVIAPERPS